METAKVPREMIIEALTEENYTSWAACMKIYLMKKDLWEMVDGTEPEPSPDNSSAESIKTWTRRNFKTLHAIQVSCGSKMFSYIIMESSAKAAWDCLASIHAWHQHKVLEPTASLDNQAKHENEISYMSLYKAVINGNWQETKRILDKHPEALTVGITTDGGTALHLAATGNNVEMVEALVNMNENLLGLRNSDDYIPVCIAALYGNIKIFESLYSRTPNEVLSNNGFALRLLDRFPVLAITQDDKGRFWLNALAQKLSSFLSGTKLSTWQRWIYQLCKVEPNYNDKREPNNKQRYVGNPRGMFNWTTYKTFGINEIYDIKVKHLQAREILKRIRPQLGELGSIKVLEGLVMPAIFQAVEAGNVEFITEMIKFHPVLLRSGKELAGCIFHKAVAQREESIWNLIYSLPKVMITDIASMKNEFDNNILHVAALLAPQSCLKRIPGPAMQMQRELRWFKEVEYLVPPLMKEQQNVEGKTPQSLFTEQHELLAKEGRIWMKDLATSCMLVSTLIATVVYDGAKKNWDISHKPTDYFYEYYIFMISDALSIMSSTFSLLIFVSIFTSRFAHEDFLESLPNMFIIGLSTLFFSIGTMMVAFAVLSFVNLSLAQKWGALGFSSLSMIPVALFAAFHFPILVQMVRYSYRSSSFHPRAKILFTKVHDSPLQIRQVSATDCLRGYKDNLSNFFNMYFRTQIKGPSVE